MGEVTSPGETSGGPNQQVGVVDEHPGGQLSERPPTTAGTRPDGAAETGLSHGWTVMLDSLPRDDSERLSMTGDRATVLGGSVAGLLAARVLDDTFQEVVVIERDTLPDQPQHRRGVPQAKHPHVLQEAGRAIVEDLYPGFGAELLSAGALMVDVATETEFYASGGFLAEAFARVVAMEQRPRTLFRPRCLWRVLRPRPPVATG